MLLLKVFLDREFYIDIEKAISIDFKKPIIRFEMNNKIAYNYVASEQLFEKIHIWAMYHRVKEE